MFLGYTDLKFKARLILFKDTQREKVASNKISTLSKSMSMDIWVSDTSNQLWVSDTSNQLFMPGS